MDYNKISVIGIVTIAPLVLHSCEKSGGERPNIIIILTDDMGYSDLSCYGSEIHTPNIDNLAFNGIRYAQFYNNARSCPSRAALMTGLYPHQAGMGWMASADMQEPGYRGSLNDHCVTLAEVLRLAGYETYMVGKWHLCSERQSKGNVVEHWPDGRGFLHYFGKLEGASNYFKANLVDGHTKLPTTGGDFYVTDAFSDTAVSYISNHDYRKKPLFLYLAYNAPHWPLHALKDDIEKHKGDYDAGWDLLREQRFNRQKELGLFGKNVQLSPRDPCVPAWDSLSLEKKEEFAMRMTIYAAQIDAIDRGVGKIVKALHEAGQFDNTVIMFTNDNGACAEYIGTEGIINVTGEADTWESYRINWANLSSTPYRGYKHYTNEGGIAAPLIISWPKGIDKRINGTIVREYGYFADIMPTCVELANTEYPKEYKGKPIIPYEGVSLVPNFSNRHVERGMTFWEHEANIAVRDGKWKLNLLNREGEPINMDKLELYDMEKDPTELHNLASSDIAKAKSMVRAWMHWAEKSSVLPISSELSSLRKQKYKRVINGEFDDNFGDWKLSDSASVVFEIDRHKTISGEKTAKITITSTGKKLEDAFMSWDYPMPQNAKGTLSFRYISDRANTISVGIWNEESGWTEVKKIALHDEGKVKMPISLSAGISRISFLLGKADPGQIWIDDVRITLDEKEE